MGYGIIRIEKIKGASSAAGRCIHDERLKRETEVSSNPDIDWSRTYLNYHLGNDPQVTRGGDYMRLIDARIAEGYKGTRAVRKDAIKAVEALVTYSNGSDVDAKAYFEDAYNYLCDRYGKDNVISFVVHMDETTPHAHAIIVPLTDDGRLSCKEVVGDRIKMQKLQDNFYREVSKKHGLDRGNRADIEGGEKPAEHKSMTQYKRDTERAEVERNLQTAQKKLDKTNHQIQDSLDVVEQTRKIFHNHKIPKERRKETIVVGKERFERLEKATKTIAEERTRIQAMARDNEIRAQELDEREKQIKKSENDLIARHESIDKEIRDRAFKIVEHMPPDLTNKHNYIQKHFCEGAQSLDLALAWGKAERSYREALETHIESHIEPQTQEQIKITQEIDAQELDLDDGLGI